MTRHSQEATIVNPATEDDNLDDLAHPDEPEAQPSEQPEPTLPEKYAGKSLEEVVRMHQEAESLLGRQSSEVGELRRVVDDFIRNQSQPVEKEVSETDFFTDPQTAVNSAIEKHPVIKEATSKLEEQTRILSGQAFINKHPDAQQIVQNKAFQDWVMKSKVRQRLFEAADQQYDYEAGDELFSTWKELQESAKSLAEADKTARSEATKRASTGSGRSAPGVSRKKKYKRADIIELKIKDPARYKAQQAEILLAYAEGRVI